MNKNTMSFSNLKIHNRSFVAVAILSLGLLVGFIIITNAQTAGSDNFTYPITELENCENKQACFTYCDNPDNIDACIDFAEEHNLLPPREIENARKFRELGRVGPGECRSENECRDYCEDINNIDECLAFAQEHGFMDEDELREARKIRAALAGGAQLPGGCRNERACEVYCYNPEHMEECIAFAEATGLMDESELTEARHVMRAMRSGHRPPGGCLGKDECEAYCSAAENIEECITFAEATGLIPPEELAEIRRILPLIQRGEMPGGCTNRAECEAYCADEVNREECAEFGIRAGFMTLGEVEQFRKTGGRGPGGCVGREECEVFCNDLRNQETCFQFAREHNFIPEEDLEHIREGARQLKEVFDTAPPEVVECLRTHLGQNIIEEIRADTLTPSPEVGERVRLCFEEFMPHPEESFLPRGDGSSEEFHSDSIEDLQRLRELRRLEDFQREEELFREQEREDDFQDRFFEDLIEPFIPDVNKEDFSTRENFDPVQENYFIKPEFGGVTCESLRYARSREFVPPEYHEKFKNCFPSRL